MPRMVSQISQISARCTARAWHPAGGAERATHAGSRQRIYIMEKGEVRHQRWRPSQGRRPGHQQYLGSRMDLLSSASRA